MFVRPSPGLVRHARQNHVGLQPDKQIRALRDDLSALDLAYPHPADRDLGAALGALHRTLVAYDGELPDLRDVVTEVAELSERVEDPTVAAAFRRKLALLMPQLEWIDRGQMRALHGGAHQGNVVGVEDELVWLDFEDACRGPRRVRPRVHARAGASVRHARRARVGGGLRRCVRPGAARVMVEVRLLQNATRSAVVLTEIPDLAQAKARVTWWLANCSN